MADSGEFLDAVYWEGVEKRLQADVRKLSKVVKDRETEVQEVKNESRREREQLQAEVRKLKKVVKEREAEVQEVKN